MTEHDSESHSVSRRRLLGSAAAVSAGAGVAMTLGAGVSGSAADAATPRLQSGAGDQPLVAHVRDPRSGEIDLFIGERHVVVHDTDLATRLANAAR